MGSFFRRVSKGTPHRMTFRTNVRELVCLGLSIPCFKLSNLCFQIAYLLQQRRLIVAARDRALLCGQDFVVHLPDPVLDLDAQTQVENRLADLKRRLERLQARTNSCNVRHGE